MDKINSINQFIIEAGQILESYHLKPTPIFVLTHPKLAEVTCSFHEFVSACKKSTQFINSFSRYSRF